MSISEIASIVFLIYLTLVFIKVMLMLTSAHVAVSAHRRYIERRGGGVEPSVVGITFCVLAAIFVSALTGAVPSLWRERSRFFVTYPTRQVIRETYQSCRMIYPF